MLSITPPRTQLLKWVGNKQKYALEITKYFPRDYNIFFEPFLGSGAIMATMSPLKGFGSDIFYPLMEIWENLVRDPDKLVGWYEERRSLIKMDNKAEVYNSIKASYNNSPNGADFLFLSRACYGGIIRFRKSDKYMSTPCGVHMPISIESFRKRVDEWIFRMRNVHFERLDYREAFSLAKKGDFIYCDPPYSTSQSILYGAQDFSLANLFNEIDKAKSKGIKVALSIDGFKKSGSKISDLPIPDNLFTKEILIDCGHSMLRRFQLEGQKMDGELVSDRLLLTY